MDQRQEIIDKVKQLSGNNFLYLDSALVVKKTPHSLPVNIWAVCVSPDNIICLMDSDEKWYNLEQSDLNYSILLSTLYQRVNAIYKQHNAA